MLACKLPFKPISDKRFAIEHRNKIKGELYSYCKQASIKSVFMVTDSNCKLFHNATVGCKAKWTSDYEEALQNNNVFGSRIAANKYLNGMKLLNQDETKDAIVSLVLITDSPEIDVVTRAYDLSWMTGGMYDSLKYKGD